jgi:Signal peptidase (SPase) II
MPVRLLLVVVPAIALAGVDLPLKALLPTAAWEFHARSQGWSVVGIVLLAALLLIGLLPSRLVSPAAGVAAAGVAGNVLSARLHGGRVPDPLIVGTIAFNLADVLVAVAAPLLTVALFRVAIRNRSFIDRHVPPRPWERAVRRRFGL